MAVVIINLKHLNIIHHHVSKWLDLQKIHKILISQKKITLNSEAGPVILPIRGVLYYTGNHFVSRMISPTGEVWYHDGIETKCQCIHEGHLIAWNVMGVRDVWV